MLGASAVSCEAGANEDELFRIAHGPNRPLQGDGPFSSEFQRGGEADHHSGEPQKEFYKLQELEKARPSRSPRLRQALTRDVSQLAPKTKGITAMSVKEVLQSLVDDSVRNFSLLDAREPDLLRVFPSASPFSVHG